MYQWLKRFSFNGKINRFVKANDDNVGHPGVEHCIPQYYPRLCWRIALITSMDTDSKKDRVLLLTMHSAKGLEFPVVFIAGAENGLFPHQRALETKSEMAEERRLAYVAITRAKEHLHICVAQNRMIYGKSEMRQPTLFLDEIPQYCLENARL